MSVESATTSSASSSKSKETLEAASDVCKPAPAPSIQVSVTAGPTSLNGNVEAASASLNEGDEMAAESENDESSQIKNPPETADEKKTDTDEMAIVSETMANASLATTSGGDTGGGCASEEQRPRGAVAEARPKEDPDAMANHASSSETQKPKQQARKKKRTPPPVQPGQSSGRWTHAEHEAFLEGLKVFGREWKKVAVRIPTRTSAQVRSHAQKYFSKLARDEQVLNQENQAYEAAASAAAAASSGSATSEGAPEPTATTTTQAYSPAIQRSVDRILADPEQAQRDVEDTLRALRERYRLLQQRLQEAPPSREGTPPSNMVEDEEDEEHNNEQQQQEDQEEEKTNDQRQQQQQQQSGDQPRRGKLTRREGDEDCSMSSASASASALSSLGNEELIALSVLGGSLPHGHHARASANAPDPNSGQPPLERNGSNSSLESAAETNDHAAIASSTSGTNTPKRKREEK